MLLSHAHQSCTLMIDFTDMQYICDRAIKDFPLAYLNSGAANIRLLNKLVQDALGLQSVTGSKQVAGR